MKKMFGLFGVLFLLGIVKLDIYGQTKAPDFTLTSIEGKKIKLSDYKGKKVIINFWATKCPACKAEIPYFVKFYNENREKVEIIGIVVWSSEENVRNIIKQFKIEYPVCISDGKVEGLYGGIKYVPTTFIIDEEGNIKYKRIGMMYENELVEILKGKQ